MKGLFFRRLFIPNYLNMGILWIFVFYSTLLHLAPLRFKRVGGCWDRPSGLLRLRHWQTGRSNHSARSHPPARSHPQIFFLVFIVCVQTVHIPSHFSALDSIFHNFLREIFWDTKRDLPLPSFSYTVNSRYSSILSAGMKNINSQ